MDKILEIIPELKKWFLQRSLWQRFLLALILLIPSIIKIPDLSYLDRFMKTLAEMRTFTLPMWAWVLGGLAMTSPLVLLIKYFGRKRRVYKSFCLIWRQYSMNLEAIQLYWPHGHHHLSPVYQERESICLKYVSQGHALRKKATLLLSHILKR